MAIHYRGAVGVEAREDIIHALSQRQCARCRSLMLLRSLRLSNRANLERRKVLPADAGVVGGCQTGKDPSCQCCGRQGSCFCEISTFVGRCQGDSGMEARSASEDQTPLSSTFRAGPTLSQNRTRGHKPQGPRAKTTQGLRVSCVCQEYLVVGAFHKLKAGQQAL